MFKIKAMLSCFSSVVKTQRISSFCARNINQDKYLSKQSKNIHTKMCVPLQNNIHEELDF